MGTFLESKSAAFSETSSAQSPRERGRSLTAWAVRVSTKGKANCCGVGEVRGGGRDSQSQIHKRQSVSRCHDARLALKDISQAQR